MAIKTHQKKFLDSLAASATFSNGHNLSVELKSKIKSKRSFFGKTAARDSSWDSQGLSFFRSSLKSLKFENFQKISWIYIVTPIWVENLLKGKCTTCLARTWETGLEKLSEVYFSLISLLYFNQNYFILSCMSKSNGYTNL